MSLDIYLKGPARLTPCTCAECGNVHETVRSECIYQSNITHNLGKMAEAAGIYQALWRPEEIGITHARQMIKPLEDGLEKLEADPEKYQAYDSPNGWGMYKHFVPFVRECLEACKKFPDSHISVSR